MKFKLRIPGRDEIQAVPVANPANPLIQIETISRLAETAANDAPDPAPALMPISRLAGHEISNAETVRLEKRQTRISWLGYGDHAEHLAKMLLHRDRDMDDRRLCVECSHAGPGWRCAKRDAFLLHQLQRCDNFKGVN